MNDGGPAFPVPMIPYDRGYTEVQFGDMTVRDYFAAAAMQGLIAGDYEKVCKESDPRGIERERREYADAIARSAYRYADAMLAEREKAKP